MTRICQIQIDDAGFPAPSPEVEQERKVAIFDLLEDNSFALGPREGQAPPEGPFRLSLAIRERRLVVEVATEPGIRIAQFQLSLGPLRQVVKDYGNICSSYFDAVKRLPPSQIEAIDMARRAIHTEGARILQERLAGKASMDIGTARRLFTLICVLHSGG